MIDCSNINLFDKITGAKTPNGTWTVSNTNFPLPVNYNDSVDICGITFIRPVTYTYTVTDNGCTDSSIVRIIPNSGGGTETRLGDNCSNAIPLGLFEIGVTTTHSDTYSHDDKCPYKASTFDTTTTLLTYYPHINQSTSRDLWFKLTVSPTPWTALTVTIDGTPYGTSGISNDWIHLYDVTERDSPCSDPFDITGDVLVETSYTDTANSPGLLSMYFDSAQSNNGGYNYSIPRTYLVRVGTFNGGGIFNLTINLT